MKQAWMMRAAVVPLLIAVGGCTLFGHRHHTVADAGDTPAPAKKKGKAAKEAALPTGLTGDKEHRAYTTDTPH